MKTTGIVCAGIVFFLLAGWNPAQAQSSSDGQRHQGLEQSQPPGHIRQKARPQQEVTRTGKASRRADRDREQQRLGMQRQAQERQSAADQAAQRGHRAQEQERLRAQQQQHLRDQQRDEHRPDKGSLEKLKHQHRTREYRLQQDYMARLAEQQRSHHGYSDRHFYMWPNYRYYRNGRYYQIDRYGADLLREAVNNGYEMGYRSGEADRLDGWGYDYRNAFAYRDANYGYWGYYVSRDEYNYYFRQGFQRGYEDGYRNTYRYGTFYNGHYAVMAPILSIILNLEPLR